MFYCNPCREARDWPESISKSLGTCELCNRRVVCNDRASGTLPLPKSTPPTAPTFPDDDPAYALVDSQSSACAAGSCISCVADDCFHPCHFASQIKEGLVIRPGDTVLFTLSDDHEIDTAEKAEDYMRRLRDALPENVHVTLIVGTQVSVIRREEGL